MEPSSLPSALADIERALSRATMRLSRLRGRNRGSGLHRDLTAIFYDCQAARADVVALLEATKSTDERTAS